MPEVEYDYQNTESESPENGGVPEKLEKQDYSPASLALVAQAEAEVKAMVAMAVRFPRDLDKVREKLLKECRRPSFAEHALYAKPVGNGKVTGLSIRFAEAAIASMQHIHVTTRTLAETKEWQKVECRVWDAQNMTSYADEATIEKTLERKSIPKGQEYISTRVNRSGELLYIIPATRDDLLNKLNAAKSKSIRNSGLRLIPGWLLDESKKVVADTLHKKDAADPDAAKRKVFDSFAEMGVGVDLIKRYLGHDGEKIHPEELSDLRAIYNAIRDGETTMQAVLALKENDSGRQSDGASAEGKATESLKDRLKASGTPKNQSAAGVPRANANVLTPDEIKKVLDLAEIRGWTGKNAKLLSQHLFEKYRVTEGSQLSREQYDELLIDLQTRKEK